jgi:adenylate cyclase
VVLFSRRISVPIQQLAEDMRKVENFEIDTSVEIHTKLREVAMVADGLRSMKQGLKSFSRYIPKDLVRQLIASGHSAELGGEKKKLTILFSDIESFTTVSEKLSSEKLLIHLSAYLDNLSQVIIQNGGTIDKYIGDSIMAFWGAPMPDDKQVYNACYSVLKCLREVSELNHLWRAQSLPLLPTRFGLNTDEVIVGNMGSSERLNYTIIGDGVNLASRLEGLNKEYGTYALVSHSVYREAKDDFVFRPLDLVAVKGKNEGIAVYELCGTHAGEFRCEDRDLERYDLFTQAFELYRARQWARALKIYKHLAKEMPNDKVAKLFVDRCTLYAKSPPPEEWDGVYRLDHK